MKVIKRLMKKLLLITLILFASNAMASSLPNCPSDQSKRYHNCFGTFVFPSNSEFAGDEYIGEFKNDDFNGQGTYIYRSREFAGDKYIGEFKNGIADGQGTILFNSRDFVGDKYVGTVKDGKKHGQGTYIWADGSDQRGYYMNGEYVPTICENM